MSGRHAGDMAAPALAFAAVFLLLRAVNQTPDGLSYALAVRTGVDMFHPHHLIYVPVARVIHLATGVDPIGATLWQNLFWVVVLAFAAWRLAGRIFPGRLAPVLAAVGLLSLRGVMIYSVRVETYLPALACLTLATALAAERPVRYGLLIPVVALAVLYHQTNVLFVWPLMVLLGEGGRKSMAGAAGTLAGAAVLVLVPYVLAAGQTDPATGFWAFALNYARAPIEAWGNFGYFGPEGIGRMAVSQVRMILPVREAAAIPGGVAMLAALVFLAVWHIVHIRRRADHLRLRLFGLVFLAVYLPFFLWWMPSDTDFFVATLLPLWLLVLILVTDLAGALRSAQVAVAVAAALLAGNLIFTIVPMHRDPGIGRALALSIDRAAPEQAEIVAGYAVQQEMLYFTGREGVHEAEGLVRSVQAGDRPWPAGRTVVVELPYLMTLLDGDGGNEDFLRWLVGYDSDTKEAAAVRTLPGGAALVVGPDRRRVSAMSEVLKQLRDLSGY